MSIVYFRISARPATAPARAPLLERLLARADAPRRVQDWRAEAFRALAPAAAQPPAVATAAARVGASSHLATASSAARWAMLATPLHFSAGLRDLQLEDGGILALADEESAALAADFNRVFAGGGVQLVPGRDALLLCLFDTPVDAATTDPEELVGQDVFAALPRGADASRLKRLASEIEMWLFEHSVNRQRRAREAAVISSLWLWGGGSPQADLPCVEGWTAGSDPLFAAFPQADRYPPRAAGGGAAARPGVVVIADTPGSLGWHRIEETFIAPALADLEAKRLARIEVSAGERAFVVSARGLRRFWRRRRPWWQSFPGGAR